MADKASEQAGREGAKQGAGPRSGRRRAATPGSLLKTAASSPARSRGRSQGGTTEGTRSRRAASSPKSTGARTATARGRQARPESQGRTSAAVTATKNKNHKRSQQVPDKRTMEPRQGLRSDGRREGLRVASSRLKGQRSFSGQRPSVAEPGKKGPSPLISGKGSRRRSPGFRTAEVSRGQMHYGLPNISPQFAPDKLRSQGRHPEAAEGRMRVSDHSRRSSLKLIPLGGLCEIGKNMTLYEYGDDMIIVDVGVAFPEEYQPGVDSVIPDMSYVFENRKKLKGIFITHGHEDHIGSISWLLSQVSAPVYALPLTCELIKLKLDDKGLSSQKKLIHRVSCGERTRAGSFSVEFVHVNHSIADAAALAIRCPAGLAIHSGDFKIDYTPIHGKPIDLQRFGELGAEGVMLFVCESTNIEREGFTPSERLVGEAFSEEFSKAPGRIIVATFSSNVHRIQQIISAAERYGRKVAISGRSMVNVFSAAQNLNYLQIRPDTLIELRDVDRYPAEKVVIITTGSQGEPMSALTRMAYSEHRNIEIGAGDTVIISATPIPGNEKPIYRVINELYKRQARVVYSALADIHVSGHAYREEIRMLHQLIKPQYFVPGHGEYRHLYMHAQMANKLGLPMDHIYILNNGDIFECDRKSARIAGYVTAGAVLIDGSPQSTVDWQILEQRLSLSDDGVLQLAVACSKKTGKLCAEVGVKASGLAYPAEMPKLTREIQRQVQQIFAGFAELDKKPSRPIMEGRLREALRQIVYRQSKRRPVLLISILEV